MDILIKVKSELAYRRNEMLALAIRLEEVHTLDNNVCVLTKPIYSTSIGCGSSNVVKLGVLSVELEDDLIIATVKLDGI